MTVLGCASPTADVVSLVCMAAVAIVAIVTGGWLIGRGKIDPPSWLGGRRG